MIPVLMSIHDLGISQPFPWREPGLARAPGIDAIASPFASTRSGSCSCAKRFPVQICSTSIVFNLPLFDYRIEHRCMRSSMLHRRRGFTVLRSISTFPHAVECKCGRRLNRLTYSAADREPAFCICTVLSVRRQVRPRPRHVRNVDGMDLGRHGSPGTYLARRMADPSQLRFRREIYRPMHASDRG